MYIKYYHRNDLRDCIAFMADSLLLVITLVILGCVTFFTTCSVFKSETTTTFILIFFTTEVAWNTMFSRWSRFIGIRSVYVCVFGVRVTRCVVATFQRADFRNALFTLMVYVVSVVVYFGVLAAVLQLSGLWFATLDSEPDDLWRAPSGIRYPSFLSSSLKWNDGSLFT